MSPPDPTPGSNASRADLIVRYFHLPILAVIVVFMFWTRYRAHGAFRRPEGGITLAAVDSWYHWRTTVYTVEHWPYTMPFDPWTGFPTGRYVGQFGTLFDQIIATVALIVGFGDPSTQTIYTVVLVMIPLLGALVAIPTYFIGKRLGGRIGGLGAALLLALFPETFFFRTSVGQLQHHVTEVLFMGFAVLAFMIALQVAEREKPVWELVIDRDWSGLRKPVLWSVLAGLALGLYMWNWPPGVALVGIMGIFFVIKLSYDYVRGTSPEHIAFVGIIMMTVAAIMMLAKLEVWRISPTSMGPLQVLLAILVAAGCLFMAWLAREFDERKIEPTVYPIVIVAGIAGALAVIWLLLPGVFDAIVDNFFRRMTPFGEHVTDRTIAEAQPPSNIPEHMFGEYGLAFYTMLVGLLLLGLRPLFGADHRSEELFIVVWSVFLLSMALTQVRFNYYLALSVAVINGYLIGLVVRWADFPSTVASIRDIDGYQIMTIATVIMILIVPLLPPVAGANVVDRGAGFGPSGDALKWEGSNEWLAENSPEIGDWGGANNADEIEYYGTYPIPDNHDFQYPEGSYGVISWWDYGHLITVQAERIPHSNPFQQHALSSSEFLTSHSEERAELLLDALPAGEAVYELSDEELEQTVSALDDQQRSEEVRYVMIDDSMAGSKFAAISTWTGAYADYLEPRAYETEDGETISVTGLSDDYDDTMVSRLYFGDATEMQHYRLVHESEFQSTFVSVAAREEGQDWQPVAINREVDAQLQFQLQQLIQSPNIEVEIFDQRQAAAVKTFERVPGATLTGAIDNPDENVSAMAVIPLNATTSNRTFIYTQESEITADGTFEITVPYATDNALGPAEGYTNSSVVAQDDYAIVVAEDPEAVLAQEGLPTHQGSVAVPESAIYDGDVIDVSLETVDVLDPDAIEIAEPEETDDELDPEDDTVNDDTHDESDADEENDIQDEAQEDADETEDADTDEADSENGDDAESETESPEDENAANEAESSENS